MWQSKARSASLREFFLVSKFDVSGQCPLRPPDPYASDAPESLKSPSDK